MIVELILNAAVSVSVVGGAWLIWAFKRKPKTTTRVPPDKNVIHPMAWSWYDKGSLKGFQCPKCLAVLKGDKHPSICDCNKYQRTHFHFKCTVCLYTNIMKSADDKK